MTDFASAFKSGQEAAAKAQAARHSIDALILKVSEDLARVTDGRLNISVQSFDPDNSVARWLGIASSTALQASIGTSIGAAAPRSAFEKGKYLAASNPKSGGNKYTRLAKWTQADEGFPCTLGFGQSELNCYDIESLATAFSDMLSNATIGEKLLTVINETSK
ncbi:MULTISPECIES: hypothetical protein [unclassified Luteibacter]|uniref:hypothetical protein n=1 Tax=Luteibacter sp. PvP019 TaxID=3156436 RepID=UPI003392F4C8